MPETTTATQRVEKVLGGTLPPPPVGFLVQDGHTGMVWHPEDPQRTSWCTTSGNGRTWSCSWDELARGKYGALTLLVPILYTAADSGDMDTEAAIARLVEHVLEPVGAMLVDLARSAAAGVLGVVREAHSRGRTAADRDAGRGPAATGAGTYDDYAGANGDRDDGGRDG